MYKQAPDFDLACSLRFALCCYRLSWGVLYAILMFFTTLIVVLLAVAMSFFKQSSYVIFFLMLMLYGLTIITMSFVLTTFFTKAQVLVHNRRS